MQVFSDGTSPDSAQLRAKLGVLGERLASLLRTCAQYKLLIDGALRDRGAPVSPSTPAGLDTAGALLSPASRASPHRSAVALAVQVNQVLGVQFLRKF